MSGGYFPLTCDSKAIGSALMLQVAKLAVGRGAKVAGTPALGQQPPAAHLAVADLQNTMGRLRLRWMEPDRVEADHRLRIAIATPFIQPMTERVSPSHQGVALALRSYAVDEENPQLASHFY